MRSLGRGLPSAAVLAGAAVLLALAGMLAGVLASAISRSNASAAERAASAAPGREARAQRRVGRRHHARLVDGPAARGGLAAARAGRGDARGRGRRRRQPRGDVRAGRRLEVHGAEHVLLRVPGAARERGDAGARGRRHRQHRQQPRVRLRPAGMARDPRRARGREGGRGRRARRGQAARARRHPRRLRRLLDVSVELADERRRERPHARAGRGREGGRRRLLPPRGRRGRGPDARAGRRRGGVRRGPRRQPPVRARGDRRGRRPGARLGPARPAGHGGLQGPARGLLARQPRGVEQLRHRRDALAERAAARPARPRRPLRARARPLAAARRDRDPAPRRGRRGGGADAGALRRGLRRREPLGAGAHGARRRLAGGEALELRAAVADDRRPVREQQVVEVDVVEQPREALAEALLLRLRVVAEQRVGEEPERAVVVRDAVGDRDRAVARQLERRLVRPGRRDRVRADAGAQLVAEVVRLDPVGGQVVHPGPRRADRHAEPVAQVERRAGVVAVREQDLADLAAVEPLQPSGGAIGSIRTPSVDEVVRAGLDSGARMRARSSAGRQAGLRGSARPCRGTMPRRTGRRGSAAARAPLLAALVVELGHRAGGRAIGRLTDRRARRVGLASLVRTLQGCRPRRHDAAAAAASPASGPRRPMAPVAAHRDPRDICTPRSVAVGRAYVRRFVAATNAIRRALGAGRRRARRSGAAADEDGHASSRCASAPGSSGMPGSGLTRTTLSAPAASSAARLARWAPGRRSARARRAARRGTRQGVPLATALRERSLEGRLAAGRDSRRRRSGGARPSARRPRGRRRSAPAPSADRRARRASPPPCRRPRGPTRLERARPAHAGETGGTCAGGWSSATPRRRT